MRMKCLYTLDVAAPLEKVFGLVDDPEKLKLWLEGLEETTYFSDAGSRKEVGTKFKQKIREGGRLVEYDGEVTAYAKPKHLGVRIFNKHFSVQVDYRFTPVADGTRLDYSADITFFNWFARILGFLFGLFMRRILKKQMAKLKGLAEAKE